jgi:hypothetical protein
VKEAIERGEFFRLQAVMNSLRPTRTYRRRQKPPL